MSETIMSGRCDVGGYMEAGHFSLTRRAVRQSPADPELLARAVRAHKEGDAMAQAVLTFALMVAIGAVALVLGGHAAMAGDLIAGGVKESSGFLLSLGAVGGAVLLSAFASRRLAMSRFATSRVEARARARSR
ncbi:hypothetical protein [Xanthobacter sp.]|uniref:hypothetical protein n=1 Tax=Xanthobacter sp. TaxID=35809 RepID=UPI0025EFDCF4|nr:hypothetical protein [Xanthobacter sp.]